MKKCLGVPQVLVVDAEFSFPAEPGYVVLLKLQHAAVGLKTPQVPEGQRLDPIVVDELELAAVQAERATIRPQLQTTLAGTMRRGK